MKIAVIGAGTITQAAHLPALSRLDHLFDVAAICDLSAGRANWVANRSGAGVRATTRASDILDDPYLEAVLLATPGDHSQLVRRALEAGKHVLVEKPLCYARAECDSLADLARERGLVLQVGYMKMYDPVVDTAAAAMTHLGTPSLIRITVLHPSAPSQLRHLHMREFDDVDPAALMETDRLSERASSDALGDVPSWLGRYYRDVLAGSLIHELSVLRALGLPLPTRFEQAETWPWPFAEEPPSLLATAFPTPTTLLVLSWNWLPRYPRYREEVAVFFPDTSITLDMAPPYYLDIASSMDMRAGGVTAGTGTTHRTVHTGHESGFVAQLRRFADCISGTTPLRSDAHGASLDLACLQALASHIGSEHGINVGGELTSRPREALRQP